jgi:hypothetical protein
MRIRTWDLFVGVNLVLFALLAAAVYLQRFVRYRGAGNLHEFFIYGCAILALILVAWLALRHHRYPPLLYVAAEAGILAHFAGAFVTLNGRRLYDLAWAGLGYDSVVHTLNAAVGAGLLIRLLADTPLVPWVRALIAFMVVMGAGAVVEVLEFWVSLNVPNAGVGDYVNNMSDLVANGVGAAGLLAAAGVWQWSTLQATVTAR